MEEDWSVDANAPAFSLFDKIKPADAVKQELVDPFTYNRWSKAERREYRRLRVAKINDMLKEQKLTVDDLTQALADLTMFRDDQARPDKDDKKSCDTSSVAKDDILDDLISKVEKMKLIASSRC